MNWRAQGNVRWLEAELPGAHAAFTTRVGGVSARPFESLNLGLLTGDDAALVRENRHRLMGALELDPSNVLIGRQVHATEIATHDGPMAENAFAEPGPRVGDVDGHVTDRPGLVPLVFVADCLPVALSGPEGVAMVHCGWRGLAGGILAKGATAVSATAAAIGPGIGRCCYEVGEEVLAEFEDLGAGVADGHMLDLTEVARRLLGGCGVEEVEASGLCTRCEAELFFSHRRDDGRTGRQAGLVWRCLS